jgi:hypothetical protein
MRAALECGATTAAPASFRLKAEATPTPRLLESVAKTEAELKTSYRQ